MIVLSSQYWGKQQTAPIRRLVCLGLRLEAALSMLFFAVVSLWPAQCVGLFVTGRSDQSPRACGICALSASPSPSSP